MKLKFIGLLVLLLSFQMSAQNDFVSNDLHINEFVEGTLLAPKTSKLSPRGSEPVPLAIIINDYGSVDRNGNQVRSKNYALKKLAEALAEKGIASFRYDKRVLKAAKLKLKEKDFRFDDYVADAVATIDYFRHNPKFGKRFILGHGQGSLVGMLAAKDKADGFISIEGAGQRIDGQLVAQIARQAPGLKDNAEKSFAELRKRGKTKNFNPALNSLFRKELQPFMASWMAYDPSEEIKELKIPVLIIAGGKDLMNNQKEAELLKAAKPTASFVMLKNMNHVFRNIQGNDDLANQKTYNDSRLPIASELVETIVSFIDKN